MLKIVRKARATISLSSKTACDNEKVRPRQLSFLAALTLTMFLRSEAAGLKSQPAIAALHRAAPSLDLKVLRAALAAHESLKEQGLLRKPDVLAVIDYSLPSTKERLWILDLGKGKLLFHELVAHGKNTGDNLARRFSNEVGSEMTSLGVFLTGDTYIGRNGVSLKLQGLDEGFNDASGERAIVMHGADYVNPGVFRTLGRLGRSQGCPAVRRAIARPLIETLREGAMLFSWYPDSNWLSSSRFLRAQSSAD